MSDAPAHAPHGAPPATAAVRPEPVAPFRVESLPVADGHRLHVEHWGRDGGRPVLVLHGGPGSGGSPVLCRAFDAERFHVLMPDQRGAGRSQPAGRLVGNATASLVDDVERLRERLGAERWALAGGSWGATLALAVAAAVPQRVSALLLRNPFLARRADVDAFFRPIDDGRGQDAGRAWQALVAVAPPDAHGRVLPALAARLTADDALDAAPDRPAIAAALAWWRWEAVRSGHGLRELPTPDAVAAETLVRRYRVQAHYLSQDCFLGPDGVLPLLDRLPAVPIWLLQGQRDAVCPPAGAALLHARLPTARLLRVDGAGHDPTHPAMATAMREAVEALAEALEPGRSGRDGGGRA